MKYLIPVIVAGATIIVAGTTAIAHASGAFSGHASLTPYLYGYGAAVVLLVVATSVAIVNARQERQKPIIIPIRYGSLPNGPRQIGGRWYRVDGTLCTSAEILAAKQILEPHGLLVMNDGEPAYDVSILATKVGTSQLKFSSQLTRFTKADGEALFPAWIEQSPNSGTSGLGLFDEMRQNRVADVIAAVRYKDGENRWYKTTCRLGIDVNTAGGITVRHMHQKRIRRPRG